MAKDRKAKEAKAKKKAKQKADGSRVPRQIAGMTIPDELRRQGETLLRVAESPVMADIAAAALLAAAAALKNEPHVRAAASDAGEALTSGAKAAGRKGEQVGAIIKAAAIEAARQLARAYEDARKDSGTPKP